MTDVAEFLIHYRRLEREALAEGSFDSLGDLLKTLHLPEAERLAEIHAANTEQVIEFLRGRKGLCSCIRFVFLRIISFVKGFEDVLDPNIQGDLASLMNMLLVEYPDAFAEESVRSEVSELLEKLVVASVDRTAERVEPQIDKLADVVCKTMDFLSQLRIENARLILLDFPIGNSLPTKLLHRMLVSRGYSVETVVISLPRKDNADESINRKGLLDDALDKHGIQENDFVIYVDEWCSGVSFEQNCKATVESLKSKPAFFLPVALLTNESAQDRRFDKRFVLHHDKVVSNLGTDGVRFRHTFPPMESTLIRFGYFFWSEHDRTAGYRKMQFLGSVFSTIDAAIQDMHNDPDKLLRAKRAFLTSAAEDNPEDDEVQQISRNMVNNHAAFIELFEEAYTDYEQCREEIERIDHSSNLHAVDDAEAALMEINHAILEVARERKARICLNLAVAYLSDSTDVDPNNRFLFPHHAPVIAELEGKSRFLHECWMKLLEAAVKERCGYVPSDQSLGEVQ